MSSITSGVKIKERFSPKRKKTPTTKKPEKIQSTYIPVIKYRDYSCPELSVKLEEINYKTKAIIPVQETASNVDSVAMIGGLITIFSPIFLMSGGAHDKEISILKGEALAIEQSAKDKRCESIIKWFEKEKMTPKIT